MIKHSYWPAGALALSALVLAGCASSPAPTDAAAANATGAPSGEVIELAVGTSPTISNASLYYAQSDGIFESHGLSVTPTVAQSGAQAIPLLLNGQIQFTAADPLSAMVAIAHGTPLTIVVAGNVVPDDSDVDPSGVLVAGDSPIESLADLNGKTVATNALQSFSQVAIDAAIDAAGGDSSTVNWVEVGFAQMGDAVKGGTVDAAATTEPFINAGLAAGLVELPDSGLSSTMAGVPQVVYVATNDYVAQNPDTVKSFAAAVNEGNAALGADPELIRTVAKASTTVPPEALATITLPLFGPPLTLESLKSLEKYMVTYGILTAPIDGLDDYVVVPD